MTDLISREAAIDALGEKPLAWMESEYAQGLQNQWVWDVNVIKALPSAQPETHDKRTEKHACDCISKTAAIDIVEFECGEWRGLAKTIAEEIEQLPSAQPEPLTDKEQIIFLAAMGREEQVCKQVDDECRDCRQPYEDSLVRICHEIARKVKGALWPI